MAGILDYQRQLATEQVPDDVAIIFYNRGHVMRSYMVSELVDRPETLMFTSSYCFWSGGASYDPEAQLVTVQALDGSRYIFDITTGEMLYGAKQDLTALWVLGLSVLLLALVVVIFLRRWASGLRR